MNTVRLSTLSLTVAIAVMTLGYANPSFANPPDEDGEHEHGGGGGGDATFDVFILEVDVDGIAVVNGLDGRSGLNNPWLESVGGKNAIGLNDATAFLDVGVLMGLAGFTGEVSDCFPGDQGMHASADPLHQAIVKKGKRGTAEANFWFHGATDDGSVDVLYVLKLFGEFVGMDVEFPGTADLLMDEWELKVENEGRKIKMLSCENQGMGNVTITVTERS